MYWEHHFAHTGYPPAIDFHALSIIFKTFRVTIQLYPEEFRKRLEDTKN
jgi:hypothetical protein